MHKSFYSKQSRVSFIKLL